MSLWVNQDSVKQLSYADPQATPASNAATALTQLLQTAAFDMRIAQESPLYWSTVRPKANLQATVVDDLSKKVKVVANGPDLIGVSFSSKYRQMGVQLLQSVLKEAPSEIARLNQLQAASTVAYYTKQKAAAQKRLDRLTQQLAAYLHAHNISPSQMAAQALFDPKFAQLYQGVQSAQEDVRNANQQLAQVASAEGTGSSIQVIDPPNEVISPVSKKTLALYFAIGFLVGILLSGAFVVITTARDKSLRYADEVPDLLGVPVLATIPFSADLARKGRAR
jgi:capsular polysaccharide biosynthesis protein